MTGTSPHVVAAQAHVATIVELGDLLNSKLKRHAAITNDQSSALRTIDKLKAQIQTDGVAAILSDVPYDPPDDLARQLRKATAKEAPCGAALAALDLEIGALRQQIEDEESARALATCNYTTCLQTRYAGGVKDHLQALLPHFAKWITVDTLRARHASGVMSGMPAGGDRPYQSTQVLVNFLKAIPPQIRPEGLTLDAIQHEALKHIQIIEAELKGDSK